MNLVPAHELNPEDKYYYQSERDLIEHQRAVAEWGYEQDTRQKATDKPKIADFAASFQKFSSFTPTSSVALNLLNVLKSKYGIAQLCAVEVDHCVQSYACVL